MGLLGRFPHHFRVHPHIQAIQPFSRIVFLKHIDTSGFAKVVPSKVCKVESERNLGKILWHSWHRVAFVKKAPIEEIAESLRYFKKLSTNSLGPKIIILKKIISFLKKMLKRSGSHKIHLIIISWSWLRPNWRHGLLSLLGKWLRRRRWGIQHVCLASEELLGII